VTAETKTNRYLGAGDGNRTRMTSLEGWDSAIELRPQNGSEVIRGSAANRPMGGRRTPVGEGDSGRGGGI